MPTIRTEIIKTTEVAENTFAFEFERPGGFVYKAGQYIDLSLKLAETDEKGNTRSFSLASAPCEDRLMIATRYRPSAFKNFLKDAPPGTAVEISGPLGSLTLHSDTSRPAVFLAGGIGITPFRSMSVQAAEDKLPHRIFLFYANRRPEDAPFLREFEELEKANPRFTFIPTITHDESTHVFWDGETGRITRDMIAAYVQALATPIYYIAGPPPMVSGLHAVLNNAGVNDDNIRIEEFAGY